MGVGIPKAAICPHCDPLTVAACFGFAPLLMVEALSFIIVLQRGQIICKRTRDIFPVERRRGAVAGPSGSGQVHSLEVGMA